MFGFLSSSIIYQWVLVLVLVLLLVVVVVLLVVMVVVVTVVVYGFGGVFMDIKPNNDQHHKTCAGGDGSRLNSVGVSQGWKLRIT